LDRTFSIKIMDEQRSRTPYSAAISMPRANQQAADSANATGAHPRALLLLGAG
jgi:hypothetical protein